MYEIKQISRRTVFRMLLLWCILIVVDFNGAEASHHKRTVRLSDQKCLEYMQAMHGRQKMKDQPNNEKKFKYPKSKFRHSRKENRRSHRFGIHGGKQTRSAEYPHMGALGWYSLPKRDWEFQCGASLISSNFVLTAAHCTKIVDKLKIYETTEPKIVRLGARNIRKSNYERYQDYEIVQIKVHQKYISPNNNYDIALLKLSREVQFTKFIHPACLATDEHIKNIPKNQLYTVTGWGKVAHAGQMVDDLRYGVVDLVDQKTCDLYLDPYRSRNWKKIALHQICAGKMDGSVDTCNGDSGGPLQYKLANTKDEGTMHVIVGITAFGSTKCATKNLPSLYTRVNYFISWIEHIVWPFYNTYVSNKRTSLHKKPTFNNSY